MESTTMEPPTSDEELNNQSSHNSLPPVPIGDEIISSSALSRQVVFPIGENDEVIAELLSSDLVSQIMREQDAELLERMHYAASQVSQYSPGTTPDLKPIIRSLPIGDDSLVLAPTASSSNSNSSTCCTFPSSGAFADTKLSVSPGGARSQSSFTATTFADLGRSGSAPQDLMASGDFGNSLLLTSTAARSGSRSSHSLSGSAILDNVATCNWDKDSIERDLIEEANASVPSSSSTSRFRRLLSGEIWSMEPGFDSNSAVDEEEEKATASPVSVAHEAAAIALKHQQKKETGLAEKRRVQEAMQFAEAVGENLGINRSDIRIIEDHAEDSESDGDDDGCKSKEIVVDNPDTIQEALTSSQANSDNKKPGANLQDAQEGLITPLATHGDILPRTDLTRRFSKRPQWPFGPAGSDYDRFLDRVSDGLDSTNFEYKGICANPPEITKRGIQRGNYAQLHRKAWLEVSDKYHRYGKNLRLYYRYWERLGFPTNQFFDWLDSKGEAAGHPLPNLDECPRSTLDSDTVLYISNPEATEGYALEVVCNEDGRGRIIDVDSSPVITGSDGWIFVLRDNAMYGAEKITSITGQLKQRFHHSSFFGGKAVAAAGIIITDDQGYLSRLYPHSGHYRPSESHMQRMLFFLHRKGVDLRTFDMDTQQFRHVSREKDITKSKNGDKNKDKAVLDVKDSEIKMKKVDSLHLEKAVNVACFLAHKAGFIGNGIFDNIHKIRRADVTSVSEALDMVDNGGFWSRRVDIDEDKEVQVQVVPTEKAL